MCFLSTKIHGILDYLNAIDFITMPLAMHLRKDGSGAIIFMSIGIEAVLCSAFTNYEPGIFRKLYVPSHLILDAINGIFLAASPWLFGFADENPLMYVCAGIFSIVFTLITRKKLQITFQANSISPYHFVLKIKLP